MCFANRTPSAWNSSADDQILHKLQIRAKLKPQSRSADVAFDVERDIYAQAKVSTGQEGEQLEVAIRRAGPWALLLR
jgi:hypothetical protein